MDCKPGLAVSMAQTDAQQKIDREKAKQRPIVVSPRSDMQRQAAPEQQKKLTPMNIMRFIQDFQTEQHRWPTSGELVAYFGCARPAALTKLRELRFKGWLEDGDPLTPTETAPLAGDVKTEKWTPEQITAHLESLKPQSASPFRQPPAPAKEPTAPAKPIPQMEAQQEMPRGIPLNWPDDQTLVAEAQALHDSGQNVTAILKEKYKCQSRSRLWEHIGDARERCGLPREMGGHVFNPVKPAFLCSACRDSGYKGGGSSGEPCDCEIGRRIREGLFGGEGASPTLATEPPFAGSEQTTSTEIPPAALTVAEPAATAAPQQGVGPSRNAEPPARPTERNGGTEIKGYIEQFADGRIAELEQQVKDLQSDLAPKNITIQKLTEAFDRQMAANAKLVHDAAIPILLLIDGPTIRTLPVPEGSIPNPGDHWPESVDIGGHRRYNIWHCVAEGEIDGMRPVRLLRLMANTAEMGEAA